MPTAERYARYREAQTTIWVSKTAAAFLARERTEAREGTAAVLDRLLTELRRLRRSAPSGGSEASREAPARTAGATRTAAKRPAATKRATTRGTATRAKTARGGGTRSASRRSA